MDLNDELIDKLNASRRRVTINISHMYLTFSKIYDFWSRVIRKICLRPGSQGGVRVRVCVGEGDIYDRTDIDRCDRTELDFFGTRIFETGISFCAF